MTQFKDLAVVILAAGKGTRMKSDLAKVLHKVAGKSMVLHVIECALRVVPEHVHVVVGHQADMVKSEISTFHNVCFSIQKQLLGTGDAVKSALPDLDASIKDVLVLCGDVPLIRAETLKNLIEGHRAAEAKVTVLATDVNDPTGYGRIVLDQDNKLSFIVEEADATELQKQINKVNTGIYCFDRETLTRAIELLKPDNKQSEYYLTDVIRIAKEKHQKVHVISMDDPRQVIGVNTLEELEHAGRLIQEIGK